MITPLLTSFYLQVLHRETPPPADWAAVDAAMARLQAALAGLPTAFVLVTEDWLGVLHGQGWADLLAETEDCMATAPDVAGTVLTELHMATEA